MRVAAALLVAVVVAGCGSAKTPEATGPATVVMLEGAAPGTAHVRDTSIALDLAKPPDEGTIASLDRGLCRKPQALQPVKALGDVEERRQSWAVAAPPTFPLAIVLRIGGFVLACGQIAGPS